MSYTPLIVDDVCVSGRRQLARNCFSLGMIPSSISVFLHTFPLALDTELRVHESIFSLLIHIDYFRYVHTAGLCLSLTL